MNETPFPLIVSATSAFGASPPARKRANTARSAAWSWPSHVSTSQPNARSFVSRSPSARISSVGLSDWSSLRSTTIQSPPSRSCAADWSASQFWPSCSSPSPVITTARPPRPARRLPSAIPRPFEMPIPSEPEFASMPGTPTSGWPSSPPSRRRRARRSAGMTPSPYSAAYRPGHVVALRGEEHVALGVVEADARRRSAPSRGGARRCRAR